MTQTNDWKADFFTKFPKLEGMAYEYVAVENLVHFIEQTRKDAVRAALEEVEDEVQKLKSHWDDILEKGNPNDVSKAEIFGFMQCYVFMEKIIRKYTESL